MSACDCAEFKIFREKRKIGEWSDSSTERGGLGSGGGGGTGDGAKISSGAGSVSGKRIEASFLGSTSSAGFGKGVEGGQDSFDGRGVGRWGSDEEFGCGAGGESGAVHCGRSGCDFTGDVRKDGGGFGAWGGGVDRSRSRYFLSGFIRASAGFCGEAKTSFGETSGGGDATEGGVG